MLQESSVGALQFPEHFPPKDRWGKFFLGVRWLGPDLSFFDNLKKRQALRATDEMGAWGSGERRRIADAISRSLAQQLGWKSQVFLPEDSVAVIFHGPRFDFCDPESAFEEVVEVLKRDFSLEPKDSFWRHQAERCFGDLVDDLLALRNQHE